MTAPYRLSKHHGLANDFLVALWTRNPGLSPRADVARAWCDRRRGIGADGVLWLLGSDRPGIDGRMVLHNSDGSEAEISGNGIRCLAQAVVIDRGVADAELLIETAAGDRRLTVTRHDDRVHDASVQMGPVGSGVEPPAIDELGLAGVRHVGTGDVGNPHLVIDVEGAWGLDPSVHGSRIEAAYPGGINVHLVEANDDVVRMRIWERGAGVTQACGSGATVVAHLARRWGLVAGPVVRVEMPGGVATITEGPHGPVLSSVVVHIADIETGDLSMQGEQRP